MIAPFGVSADRPLKIPHRFEGPFLKGRIIKRRVRFLTDVALDDGRVVEAHLADRGRLESIIEPGAEVWLAPSDNPARKTAFTTFIARSNGVLVCVDPAGANRLVVDLIRRGALPSLGVPRGIRTEVKIGGSRFDIAIDRARGATVIVEVKSVTACRDGVGMFPDAPSERASRHTRELTERVIGGAPAAIVLCAQRGDVRRIKPHPVDPQFAVALHEARKAGVKVVGVTFEVTPQGFQLVGRVPVAAVTRVQ